MPVLLIAACSDSHDVGGSSGQTAAPPDGANTAPSIISTPQTRTSINQPYRYQVEASDPDAGDRLTYAFRLAPDGFTINPASGEITGTPRTTGPADFDITVTDAAGASDRQIFLLRVNNGPNDQPPVLDPIAGQNVNAGDTLVVTITASDPENEALRYDIESGPPGLVINAATGVLEWTPTSAQTGVAQATVTVTDPGGQAASADFAITVGERIVNQAPSLASVDDQSTGALDPLQLMLMASDPDAGDILTFSFAGMPPGFQLDPTTGTVFRPPNSDNTGPINLTATVTDSAGASASRNFTVNVAPPDFPTPPAAPIAIDDNYVVDRRDVLEILAPGVFGNDQDADTPAEQLTANLVQDVTLGDLAGLNTDGSFTYTPPAAPVTNPQLQIKCQNFGPESQSTTPVVADVDNDGDIEIVFPDTLNSRGDYYIINGADCSIQASARSNQVLANGGPRVDSDANPALLDIDGDSDLEIISFADREPESEGFGFDSTRLVATHHDGTLAWPRSGRSEAPTPLPGESIGHVEHAGPVLYDLDGDGVSEILAKFTSPPPASGASNTSVIVAYDSRDGSIIWQYTSERFDKQVDIAVGPVVADIDLDGTPEILVHTQVISHEGELEFALALPPESDVSELKVAVANFDTDPFAEIVAYNSRGRYLFNHDGGLVWQFSENNGGANSPIMVADFDGDGAPEFSFITRDLEVSSSGYQAVYEGDGSLLWNHASEPGLQYSSLFVSNSPFGSVAFDANGDGADDVVTRRRDSSSRNADIYIYDGRDGSVLSTIEARGGSNNSFVVVADVDNDGAAEFVTGGFPNSRISIFEGAPANPFPPARPLRNQWYYSPTIVNLDATIIANLRPFWLIPGQNKFLSANTVAGVDPDATDSFTYTASDDSATSNEATVNIAISTTNSPSILSVPVETASPGIDYEYGVLAGDADIGDTFTYTLVDAPAGASISDLGIIRYTPAAGDLDNQRVQVVVTDRQGNSTEQTYSINVQPPVTVPDINGLAQADAATAITDAGLTVGSIANSPSASVPEGQVSSQGTPAGDELAPGSRLDFVLSIGPAPVSVPNLTGLSQAAAGTRLNDFDLTLGNITRANSDTQPAGTVAGQSLPAASRQTPGTAVDLVVSSGPALQVRLAQPIIAAGERAPLQVQVFDNLGQPLSPQPAVNFSFDALPGATGAAPQASRTAITTSSNTRGGFTLTVTADGFGSRELDVTVRGETIDSIFYGPMARFARMFEQAEQTYGDILTAVANGDTAAAMAGSAQLLDIREGIDLSTLAERTPFAAETGFIPTPEELRARGFAIGAAPEPAIAPLFAAMETALTRQIDFLRNLNADRARNDDVRYQALNGQLRSAATALLEADMDTADYVHAASELHVLLSVLIPQLMAANLDANIMALRDNGLLAATNASPAQTPAQFYAQRKLSVFTVSGLLFSSTTAVSLAKDLYLDYAKELFSSALILAQADLLSSFGGVQEITALITAASQSFHIFTTPNSVIELIGASGDPRNFTVQLIGPDLVQAAIDAFSGAGDAENLDDAFEAIGDAREAIGGGAANVAGDQVVRGCLFDQVNDCSELVIGAGFPSVHSAGQFPAPVLFTVTDNARAGNFYVDVFAFFPQDQPEEEDG